MFTIPDGNAMYTVLSRDGTRIAYNRSGNGPALLLVHGTTADRTRWDPLRPLLESSLTIAAMDRRGRGESGDGPVYHIEREFEDVAAVVDDLGGPVFVLGHSFGAICSIEATLRTANIARLIAYEPPIGMSLPRELMSRIQVLIESSRDEEALATFLLEGAKIPSADLEMMRRLPVWKIRVAAAHTIPREVMFDDHYRFEPDRFSSMTAPTLMLVGSSSAAGYVEATKRVHAALPQSRIESLDGQRHTAMDTAPEAFADAVLRFLLD